MLCHSISLSLSSAFEAKTETLLDTTIYCRTNRRAHEVHRMSKVYIINSSLHYHFNFEPTYTCTLSLGVLISTFDLLGLCCSASRQIRYCQLLQRCYTEQRKWPVKLTLLVFTFKRNLFIWTEKKRNLLLLPFIIFSSFRKYNI